MKYSNECRRIAQLILSQRESVSMLDSAAIDRLKPYKDLLIDSLIQDPNAKDKIAELLKYQHHVPEAQQLLEWSPPRFPVLGGTLMSKGVQQGPNFKKIMDQLREAWKNSHFQATEQQLIEEELPHILENLADTNKTKSITTGRNSSTSSHSKKHKQNP